VKQLHFISGLPRSSSTLLAGISRQNPQFHGAIFSPVAPMTNVTLEQMGARGEFSSFFDQDKPKRICRSLFKAYYQEEQADKDLVFDTNPIWSALKNP
jgi:sulfotransferase